SSGFGMSLTATPSNGITGGCLLTNDTNIWGNDNATYCSKFKGVMDSSYAVSICFKYDTNLIHTSYFERPVSIWLVPGADWNPYFTYTIENTILHIASGDDYKNSEFEILNVSGQNVFASKLTSSTNEFDLSHLPGGLYFLYFRTAKKNYTTKLIVTQ